MNEDLNSNNIENKDYHLNTDDSVYKILIARLKQIRRNIALLEKTVKK